MANMKIRSEEKDWSDGQNWMKGWKPKRMTALKADGSWPFIRGKGLCLPNSSLPSEGKKREVRKTPKFRLWTYLTEKLHSNEANSLGFGVTRNLRQVPVLPHLMDGFG